MTTLEPPVPGRPYALIRGSAGKTPLDIPEADFIHAYKTYGAVLLRDFSFDMDAFRSFAERYCAHSMFNESAGREVLDEARNIQTVNIGAEAFPLHPELSRDPWKPDACFFWCMHPPTEGGETTICDGVDIVRRLPPAVRAAFAQRRLRYIKPATPEECAFWLGDFNPNDALLMCPPPTSPYRFGRVEGRIVRYFTRPALHTPMFSPEPAFGNFLLFNRYLRGVRNFPTFENGEFVSDALLGEVKAVSDDLTAAIEWRANDLIILDNTRFMHGRRAVRRIEERRIATYFGYLKFALPNPEDPVDPPWRRGSFRPP